MGVNIKFHQFLTGVFELVPIEKKLNIHQNFDFFLGFPALLSKFLNYILLGVYYST
jgi:hypothetical protein